MKCLVSGSVQPDETSSAFRAGAYHASQSFRSCGRRYSAMLPLCADRTKRQGEHESTLSGYTRTSRLMCCAISCMKVRHVQGLRFDPSPSRLYASPWLLVLACVNLSPLPLLTSLSIPTSIASCCISSLFEMSVSYCVCGGSPYHIDRLYLRWAWR
jgi:hypothetical protein